MKLQLSPNLRVLVAFFLSTSLSIGAFSSSAHASNTAQLDVATIIAFANADRAANGAPALTEDTLLDRAAQLKANDMAAKGYFAHVSPAGVTPWDWFKAVGYYYYDAGENLAQGYSDPESLNTAWMNSPTHRANIVNPVYKKVGIGIATGTYEGRTVIFVAEEFANPYVETPVIAKAPAAPTVAKAIPAQTTASVKGTATKAKQTVTAKKAATVSKKKMAVKKAPIKRTTAKAVLPKKAVTHPIVAVAK